MCGNKNRHSCVVFILVLALKVCVLNTENSDCITPNGERGQCISIYSCSNILEALSKRTPSIVEFTQQSRCGCNKTPMVCCGPSAAFITTSSQQQTPKSCTTPNGQTAKCISLYNCGIFLDAFASRNHSVMSFIRESHCGCDREPMVCCGSDIMFTEETAMSLRMSAKSLLPNRKMCGLQHVDDRIYLEPFTALDEFPWLVHLRYAETNGTDAGYQCAGSLINRRYVLTSARCMHMDIYGLKLVEVRLGDYNITSKRTDCVHSPHFPECTKAVEDLKIEETISHTGYNGTTYIHDIALIRLERNIRFTDFIRPICLPVEGKRMSKVGENLITTGWGRTDSGARSAEKKSALNTIISKDTCDKILRMNNNFRVQNGQFCASDATAGSTDYPCVGDSGGPGMIVRNHQWHQEGISSYSQVPCQLGAITTYTDVPEHMDWILKHIRA